MRKVLLVLALSVVFSCAEGNKAKGETNATAELLAYEALEAEEEDTKRFIEDYLRDVKSSNWKSKLPKYFLSNPDDFLEEHAAFRESFANYKSMIKHVAVDGNEGIVWLNITANYAKIYSYESEKDAYNDSIFFGIEAENQSLSWDEVWYFDVVDGKFGDKWDFLKDNHTILKTMQAVAK